MKSIIVGGGRNGYNLLKALIGKGNRVTLIDKDKNICEIIAQDTDAVVFCGDGTDLNVLKDAGIEKAEYIVAVTGNDEDNFIICQIAKTYFNVKNTIASVANPSNAQIFKTMGVDKTICLTEGIVNLVLQENVNM